MIANPRSFSAPLRLLAFGVMLGMASHAHAADEPFAYVAPDSLPPQLLTPPPQEGTPAWRREIAGVLAAQEDISKADRAALRDEQHLHISHLTSVIGPDFTPQRYPK